MRAIVRTTQRFFGTACVASAGIAATVSCGARSTLEDVEGEVDAAPECTPASSRWLAIRAAPADDEQQALVAVRVTNDAVEFHRLSEPEHRILPRVEWSNDGAFLAFTTLNEAEQATTHVFRMDCAEPVSVIDVSGSTPTWGHGGVLAAGVQIAVVDGNALPATPVLPGVSGSSATHSPKLSDGGRWIGFRSLAHSQGQDLFVVEISAAHPGKPTQVVATPGGRVDGFAFTPDEHALVFAERAEGELRRDLYLLELPPNGPPRRLNPALAPGEQIGWFADAWASDGAELLYRTERTKTEEFELYRLAHGTPNALPLEVNVELPPGHAVRKVDVARGGRQLLLRAGPHVGGGLRHVAHAVVDAAATTVSETLGVHEAGASSGLAPPSADGRSAFVYIDEAGDLVLQRVSARGLETATVLWRPRNLELSETLEWQPDGE